MESKPSLESSKNKDKEQGNKNKSLYRLGAIVAGAATGIGLLAWGLSALGSSAGSESEENKKTMKAPGKDEIIEREEFERDPKGYFRALRDKSDPISDFTSVHLFHPIELEAQPSLTEPSSLIRLSVEFRPATAYHHTEPSSLTLHHRDLSLSDDGGGMDPEGMRKCMSLGYSTKKANTTIGQLYILSSRMLIEMRRLRQGVPGHEVRRDSVLGGDSTAQGFWV